MAASASTAVHTTENAASIVPLTVPQTAALVVGTVALSGTSYIALLQYNKTGKKRWLIASILGYGASTVPYAPLVKSGGTTAPLLVGMASTTVAMGASIIQGRTLSVTQTIAAAIALGAITVVQLNPTLHKPAPLRNAPVP